MPVEEAAIRDQAAMEVRRRDPGGRRVTVVYYLCRHGRHLEHPHLMELTLSSPNHTLCLRDVIHRLDDLRGKGMAAMYSWSCKRRYKTGFVWHDVTEDDVLLPAQGGSEYVLKGSLLPLRHSIAPADQEQQRVDATSVPNVQCVKQPIPQEELPAPSRGSQQAGWMTNRSSSSPPPMQQLQQQQQVLSSSVSPSSSTSKDSDQEAARSSSSGSSSSPNKPTAKIGGSGGSTPSSSSSRSGFSLSHPLISSTPNKDQKPVQSSNIATVQEAAEQTDGAAAGKELPNRTKGDAGGGRNGTLESLIRAEARVRRGGSSGASTGGRRVLLEEDDDESSSLLDDREAVHSLGTRLKPANLLMRLVACGSALSTSNHPGCGFMRPATYNKPQYVSHPLQPPPPSPVLAPLGALIMRRETTGSRTVSESRDRGTCSCRWSTPRTVDKVDEPDKGMLNSSYSPDRVSEKKASNQGNSENLECRTRIIPQTVGSEQSSSETLVTITTDVRHNSVAHECCNEPSSMTLLRSQSMRSDTSAAKTRSPKIVTFHDEKQKLVEIEERLASGARVIIQCKPLLKENYVRANGM